ncbi:MAG: RNA polymerase sigma factor [Terriglobales bacterium]
MEDHSPRTAQRNTELNALMEKLFGESPAITFGLSFPEFATILEEIGTRYFGADKREVADLRSLYSSLRIEDLVLARCCALGNERAWEAFLVRYREKLYDIAGYIAKEASAARELADSIYADLYGTKLREGQRISKLDSYTGRGSLEGWLRTVIAQEYVNQYRRRRRLVSFEEEAEAGTSFPAPVTASGIEVSVDPRLEAATDEALSGLAQEDRFVLASYFLDDKTLAEIARMLSVHESTISRKVEKLLKSLRKQILGGLGRRGMSRRQAEEALEVDIRDLRVNIRNRLTQETQAQTFSEGKAKVPGQ